MNLTATLRRITAPTVHRIPAAELSDAKRVNILAGALGTIFFVLTGGAFMTGFVKDLGASDLQVGLLAGSMTLAQFVQVPSSLLIERLRRRKFYWFWLAIIHRLMWFGVVLLPLFLASTHAPDAVWLVIGLSLVSWVLAHASAPAWLAWMGLLIPETQRAGFFGRRQSYIHLATLAATLVSGVLLDLFPSPSAGGTYAGYMLIFGLGAALGCADILIHMVIPEPTPTLRPAHQDLRMRLLAPLRNGPFLRFTIVAAVFSFGAQMSNPFGIVYCLEDLAMGWSFLVSTLGSINLACMVAGSLLWGWIGQRYGNKPILIITVAIGSANALLWFLVSPAPLVIGFPGAETFEVKSFYPLLILMNVVGGLVWSGYMLAVFNLLLGLSPDAGRAIYTATFGTVVGACGSLGPVVGGVLAETAKARGWAIHVAPGLVYGWWHLIVLSTVAVWLLMLLFAARLPRAGEAPSGVVLTRLFAGNPMRTFFHLYTIHTSSDPGKRARAVRRLGESRSALAVRDLIAALDDPDWEVRRESARSLGWIRDREVLDALVARLNDPASDIRLEAASSLGRLGGPEAAEALLGHANDPSREVRLEVVRSLGRLAYPPAERELLDLLVREPDGHVRAAAATALGRLGNLRAVLDMTSAMAAARAPRAREEIARAIGRILASGDEFDRGLARERRSPGAWATRLLAELDTLVMQQTEAHPELRRLMDDLRAVCTEEDWPAAAQRLCALTEAYARARHGVETADVDALSLRLFMHDWVLGACLFYTLALLPNGVPDLPPPDETLVLLGVFFLDCAVRGVEAYERERR